MLKKLFIWFVANTLPTILAPVLFLCVIDWCRNGTFYFGDTFKKLLLDGFYIFSALALIFCLIEDCAIFKMAGIGIWHGVWLTTLVFLTLYMFYLMQTEDTQYIKTHILQFILIWIGSAISAIYIKGKIIKYKQTIRL